MEKRKSHLVETKGCAAPSSSVRFLEVREGNVHQRLDNFLAAKAKGVPRSRLYRIIRRGEVRVNGHRVHQDYRLQAGDVVRIPPLRGADAPTPPGLPSKGILKAVGRAIVWENARLLLLNKPSGVAVHGGSGLRFGVIEALRALRPAAPYLELAHRLDRETSGCLLIAKKRSVLREFHEELRRHRVDKRYLLLVAGRWQGGGRRIETPLRKNVLGSGERMVREDPAGKSSITHMSPLVVGRRASLLAVRTLTGRTHQIRVHAASIGYPVAGDEKYGDRSSNRMFGTLGLHRLFLHASVLGYHSPGAGKRFAISAPLSGELIRVLDALGFSPKAYADP